jgi:hypothetical protein
MNDDLLTRKGPVPRSQRATPAATEEHRQRIAKALEEQASMRDEADRIRDEGNVVVGQALAEAKMAGMPMREIERASGFKRAYIATLIDSWQRARRNGDG